jgi:hypothetical protein
MNTTTNVQASSDVTYATRLAENAKLKRTLNGIGNDIESGNLQGAGAKITGLMKAYPQYAATSGTTTDAKNPINDGFKTVSDAIQRNDAVTAKDGWAQLKNDLSGAGIKNLNGGSADTSALLADTKNATDQAIRDATLNPNSFKNNPPTLLSKLTPASNLNFLNDALSTWISYQADGRRPSSTYTGSMLNAAA